MKRDFIDFCFLACLLLGSPAVAFLVIQRNRPYTSVLHVVLNVGFILAMCGALIVIIGLPWAVAGLSSRKHKEQFRSTFVGVWLVVNALMVFGALSVSE